MPKPRTIDIFCHVVDNLGDIGVTWRLARQLVAEKNCAVRLIVDDLNSFSKIAPSIDMTKEAQTLQGVEILCWEEGVLARLYAASGGSIDCVIEAFACNLPDFVIDLMVQQKPSPVWINLEYLSAEKWIEGCHAIVSPHPSTGLPKTLFFPGFTQEAGGLFREGNLLQLRDEFQGSEGVQNAWRGQFGLPAKDQETLDISLFCYKDAPVSGLLQALTGRHARIFTLTEIAAQLPQHNLGDVEIWPFDYMPQDDFDRLLWTCDLNFVRGEDSFLRALWAGRPYVWQIYTQQQGAHFVKLDAFLRYYSQNSDPDCAEALADFSGMWNVRGHTMDAASRFLNHLPDLANFACKRAKEQAGQTDLATRLVHFIETQIRDLKSPTVGL